MTATLAFLATLALSQQSPVSQDERLTELLDLLARGELQQQIGAAQDLGRLGKNEARLIDPLGVAMRSPHCSLRVAAANAVWTITSDAERVLSVLKQELGPGEQGCQAEAARGLGKLGPRAMSAFAELVRLTKASEWQTRAAAAEALGQIGPDARSALPSLMTAFHDDATQQVRESARWATYKIDTETGIRELKVLLRSTDSLARLQAASTLTQMGSRAAGAIPELLLALQDRRTTTSAGDSRGVSSGYDVTKARMQAATALGSIGPLAKQALRTLEGLERAADEDEGVRQAARQAIQAIR